MILVILKNGETIVSSESDRTRAINKVLENGIKFENIYEVGYEDKINGGICNTITIN